MQGLSSYQGTTSFLHKVTSDAVSTFELTAFNPETLSTGIFSLDSLLSKFIGFESTLYTQAAFTHTGIALLGTFICLADLTSEFT